MNSTETMSCTMYDKRSGTSGIRGQLYETKLLSLINFRAIHDANIEEFHLAANVDKIGAFDDICFKAKVKGFDRPFAVFIQAKHRENDKLKFNSKNDLAKYFGSYLKIRDKFKSTNEDVLFDGQTDCLFVIYTTARDGFGAIIGNDLVESSFVNKLNDLIGTGDKAKQSYKTQKDVEFLCKIVIKKDINLLAEKMAEFIFHQSNLNFLLADEVVLRYHVILAQKVIDVSEIQSDGHRNACFRQDFFDTNDEFLSLLKDRLYLLVLKERKLEKAEIEKMLPVFLNKPTDVEALSKLIGIMIDYKDSQLEFVDKTTKDSLKRKLSQVYIAPSIVNRAIEMAGKEKLSPLKFKVPAAFGNKDMTIQGNDKKTEKRLNYLTLKIYELINESDGNKIVTIDESLNGGFLHLNGGIASAVGNILVFDENAKLVKFTENCESLGDLAKRVFEKLKDKINNLQEYRLKVKVKNFPKLSFDCNEYDENLARDFLNKLLFYTNQADESGVEKFIKSDIEHYQLNNVNNFQARTDAIFLTYHDEIQKWWMISKQAPYLTKESGKYRTAIKNIVKDPLMSVLHLMYKNKIKKNAYTFSKDAVKSLKLQDQLSRTIIVAENIVLTVLKVMQYVKNIDHAVLDLEYILNLPTNEHNALCDEITNTPEEKILILVCDKIQPSRNWAQTLEQIAKVVENKKYIMISNGASFNKYFTHNVVHDKRNNLTDMTDESQKSILKNGRVIFQGKEVSLGLIVDKKCMPFVQGDILNRIVSKEIIEVGKSVGNSKYEEMKHLYINRRVSKQGEDTNKILETLYDIEDDVVLLTALPGMGKSTLLTHLSHKTKDLDPKVWIVRINLLEYSKQLNKWMKNNTAIGSLETLNFMCHVILNEKHGEEDEVSITLEESNGFVYLKECTVHQFSAFELKMFLHYYNKEKLIFLFDGFDEICPFYADNVIKCINIVRKHHRKHKIWIASRPYSEIKSVLESNFSQSYEIKPFSYDERGKYLEQFWKTNLIFKELNDAQRDNVYEFISFMFEFLYTDIFYTNESELSEIYKFAMNYFINEVNNECGKYHEVKYDGYLTFTINLWNRTSYGIPLHLYLIADYFQNAIKDVNKTTERWNLEINSYTIYERFIETTFYKIRFQDKNEMDTSKPDIMITLDKERADFINKHKKLAAYALFHQDRDTLFNRKELNEIEDTIKSIKKGTEKTGFICGTENDIPIFIHMTFAEFFAAEHVCDLLKGEKQILTLNMILNLGFSIRTLELIDYKIQKDKALERVFKKNGKLIFDLLIKQGLSIDSIPNAIQNRYFITTVLSTQYIHNIKYIMFSIFESNVNLSNLDVFIEVISKIVSTYNYTKYQELIYCALNVVRNIDVSKFSSVLLKIYGNFLLNSRDMNFDGMSIEEIMKHIELSNLY